MGKRRTKISTVLLIICFLPLILGFSKPTKNPRTLYHIYLKGKSIG